jgi:hypothetical protein
MAVQAPSLDVFVDRNLPIEGANLVFASTDDKGTPGALNSWVFEQLGLSPKLLAGAAEKLEKGYAILRIRPGLTLVLIVTVGQQESQRLLERNLSALVKDEARSSDIASSSSVWLPLMGTGAGGIGVLDCLDITLRVIGDGIRNGALAWRSLRLSLGRETNRNVVDRAVQHVGARLADVPLAAAVNGVPVTGPATPPSSSSSPTSPPPTPEPPARGYFDNLQTQIDAPPVEPRLGFPDIAESIVDVVEEAVAGRSSSPMSAASGYGERQREWLSAADARLTVGIFAPWGAGKSTLINALRSVFTARDYPVFAVNPWKWDGKQDLHDHVRTTVIEQAREQGKVPWLVAWLKLRTFWRHYAGRIFWTVFAVALALVFYQPLSALLAQLMHGQDKPLADEFGVAVARAVTKDWLTPTVIAALGVIAKFAGPPLAKWLDAKFFKGIPEKLGAEGLSLVYRDIASLIYRNRHPPRPFVFFFDDLDRCSPERVAAVLESVHSLTMAGCIVFLACDDEYVTAALNAHYEKVAKVYRDGKVFGRSYLEKIVQIHFKLPLLKNVDIYELGLAESPAARAKRLSGSTEPSPGAAAQDLVAPAAPQDESPDLAPLPEGRKVETDAQLQEIIGDLLGEAVEPLGLNVRQAKSISNTLKLYLRIGGCRTEGEARRLAAFVFADRLDPRWLDSLYRGAATTNSPIGAVPDIASRLSTMIGQDQAVMLSMYRLLGRRPSPLPQPTKEASPDSRASDGGEGERQ